ncbi:MAG: TRAP transporter small permease [Desulfobacteraceae bacterium]|nr:MAG: TRAP transporter small permease [Desulfobacteraceae bacterium]
MEWFSNKVKGLSNVLNIIAGISITFIIVLTVVDVILKNRKMAITGTYELCMFAGAMVISFALPMTTFAKGHVLVDFLVLKFSRKMRNFINIVTRLMGVFLFAIASWNMFKIGMSLARTGEVSMTLQLPMYPIAYGIAFSFLVQCLVLITQIGQIIRGSYE